jgi:carbonic anhydrase
MKNMNKLLLGYKKFYQDCFVENKRLFKHLAIEGQSPKTLVVACSDSRVDPATILNCDPGEIFVIRNVANLIPPYEPEGSSYHGTSAAIEFAVCHLEVEDIIIMGHSGCGGVHALMESAAKATKEFSFIREWMKIAEDAKDKILKDYPALTIEQRSRACEKKAMLNSLSNLLTFPWIKARHDKNKLGIHAWHFDIETGIINAFNPKKHCFEKLSSL